MKFSFCTLMAAASMALAHVAAPTTAMASTLLVNWGGNYVAADSNLNSQTSAIPNGLLYNYSDSTPKSPTAKYSGTSDKFYGVAQSTYQMDGGSGELFRIVNNGSQDTIRILSRAGGTTNTVAVQGLLFWKQEDFLDASRKDSPLSLADLGEFSVHASSVRGNAAIRFAVLSDNVWYLSEEVKTASTGGTPADLGTFVLDNAAGINWAKWEITAGPSNPLPAAPTLFDISGETLNNITAVGFYFSSSYSAANRASMDFSGFSVTAIPEAGSVSLMGIASTLVAAGMLTQKVKSRPQSR